MRVGLRELKLRLTSLTVQVERGPGKAHLQDNIEYLYTSLKSLYRCRARS